MELILFAKHLKPFDIPELVRLAGRIGVDGYDVPVREGYAVSPDNVTHALKDLVKAMASEGLRVPMCTAEGDLVDPAAAIAEPLLNAMAENGVSFLKLGYFLFDATRQDYWEEVRRARATLEQWADLAEKYDVTVCCHTHAGGYLGCNASALMHLIQGFNPAHIGAYLDTGHLSAAGEDFPIACNIVGPYLRIVGLKDVVRIWKQEDGTRYLTREAVPLGDGLTDVDEAFAHLSMIGFHGPLSIHIEYEGDTESLIEASQRETKVYRAALTRATQGRN